MKGRAFQRVPLAVKVEFRTDSSFLVAYSVNLSRGGIFLETDYAAEVGSEIPLEFHAPGLGSIHLVGRIAWRRTEADSDGPAGLGVAFQQVDDELGKRIDYLVARFAGLKVMTVCARDQDGPMLARLVRSVLSTADVQSFRDFSRAETNLRPDTDLMLIDVDIYTDEAVELIHATKAKANPTPIIALATRDSAAQKALAAGADGTITNPPAFRSLQKLILHTLGRPMRVAGGESRRPTTNEGTGPPSPPPGPRTAPPSPRAGSARPTKSD